MSGHPKAAMLKHLPNHTNADFSCLFNQAKPTFVSKDLFFKRREEAQRHLSFLKRTDFCWPSKNAHKRQLKNELPKMSSLHHFPDAISILGFQKMDSEKAGNSNTIKSQRP